MGRGREGEFPKAVSEEGWGEQRRRRRRVDFDAMPHRGAENDWLARGVGFALRMRRRLRAAVEDYVEGLLREKVGARDGGGV